jgi:uncharacterized SAM-binding protein YcdF (DUF218 family)
MKLFFRSRTIPVPTIWGALSLIGLLLSPLVWWFYRGESFLAPTQRIPAQILVVEGWIGPRGIAAAKTEFDSHNYQLIVISGGIATPEGWDPGGWSYAERAKAELVRLGIPAEKIVLSGNGNPNRQRTYLSAVTVVRTLENLNIEPSSVNIFTLGTHARRSYLVYRKAFGPRTPVGIISWEAPNPAVAWWHSSERAQQLMIQSVGYFYEFFFNSGRKA